MICCFSARSVECITIAWRMLCLTDAVFYCGVNDSTSLKKTFTAKEFSDLLEEIRARLEYTEVDGERVPVK